MNLEKILSCLKDVSNQLGSGMFNLDEETEQEMLECGAIDNEVEEMENGVDDAIKFLETIKEKFNKGENK
jgi:archaellum component FlaC